MNCLIITLEQQAHNFPESWVETIFLEEDRLYYYEELMELVSHVFDDCNIWLYKGQNWEDLDGNILFNPLEDAEHVRCAELNEGLEGLDNFVR
tara:strand:- start:348 stop:626 length:279 start_codon:yes stop_codon:yes gene_type:complete